MPPIYPGIGIEELIDQIESVLRAKINDALAAQEEYWEPLDQVRAEMRGVEYAPVELEPVGNNSFHVGSIPSLARDELPLSDFPYIAMVPDDITPHPDSPQHDQVNIYSDQISIHTIAKCSDTDDIELVFRRAVRMANAVFQIASSDPNLSRLIASSSNPLRVRVSEPFEFNPDGLESSYWWQAAGTQYLVKNRTIPFN